MKHRVEIKHRYSDAVLWSGEVDAREDVTQNRLLGLAVIEAIKSRAYLDGADLRGADLRFADLRFAYLRGAYLDGANLGGANLRGVNLRGVNLRGANLRGVNLRGVNLRLADLRLADLDGTDLSGADLRLADLDGTDLNGTDLNGTDLGGLKLIARASRADYEFILWSSVLGGHIIRAGCRTMTIPEYRAHVAAEYPGSDKAEETLAILDYLESRLNKFLEV